jgi:hypothetical protein
MKLEIKHLAPYFPYGLKLNLTRPLFKCNNVSIIKCDFRYSKTTKEQYLCLDNVTYGYHDIIPILRPLSDLTKEIEHNGEKFVPIEYLYNNYTPITKSVKGMYMDLQSPLDHRFDVVQKLIEWHFDVFGLIEAGLAVKND